MKHVLFIVFVGFASFGSVHAQLGLSPLTVAHTYLNGTSVTASQPNYDSAEYQFHSWSTQLLVPIIRQKASGFRLALQLRYRQTQMDWNHWPDSTFQPQGVEMLTPFLLSTIRLNRHYQLVAGVSFGIGKELGRAMTTDDLLFRQVVLINRSFGNDKRLQLGVGGFLNSAFGNPIVLPVVRVKYAVNPRTDITLNLVRLTVNHQVTPHTGVFFFVRPQGSQLRLGDPSDNQLGYDKLRQRLALVGVGVQQDLGKWFQLEAKVGSSAIHRMRFFDPTHEEVLTLDPTRTLAGQATLKLRIPTNRKSDDER